MHLLHLPLFYYNSSMLCFSTLTLRLVCCMLLVASTCSDFLNPVPFCPPFYSYYKHLLDTKAMLQCVCGSWFLLLSLSLMVDRLVFAFIQNRSDNAAFDGFNMAGAALRAYALSARWLIIVTGAGRCGPRTR